MKNNNPLVTVAIVTYNSAKYIEDALESVKNQTYKNIELIISDDASEDNTVEICRNWISKHKANFYAVKIITVEKNTGIPANFNRALNSASGEWIKFVAGDDIIYPDCIKDNIEFVKKNPEAKGVRIMG